MSEESNTALAEPLEQTVIRPRDQKKRNKPKRQPRYHVILWDDNDHSYDYVIEMLRVLFAQNETQAFRSAVEVDTAGRVICLTTTREHAELKRDQVHAYGKDDLIARCKGSMSCSIEPEE